MSDSKIPDTDPAPASTAVASTTQRDVIADLSSPETKELERETAQALVDLTAATKVAVQRIYGPSVVKFAKILHQVRAYVDQAAALEAEVIRELEAGGAGAPPEISLYVQSVRVGVDYLDGMVKGMGL